MIFKPFPGGKGEPRKYGAMTGVGCGDLEPVPASLREAVRQGVTPAPSGLISPPLSARNADGMQRLGTGTGFACAKLSEVVARSERSLASVRMTERRGT